MLKPFELEVMRDRLVYSLAVMDEQGRSLNQGNTVALWAHNWADLRTTLLELLNFVDQVRDREEPNDV
jgi:hypothetical protein